MRTFLILAALFFFLHSNFAPSWGAPAANWALVVVALSYFGGAASKIKLPRQNRIYNNDYYDQQHH